MAVNYSYAAIRLRLSCLRRINKLLKHQDHAQTKEVYLTIRRLKHSKCLEQQQAVGINHDLLVKTMTLSMTRWRAYVIKRYCL